MRKLFLISVLLLACASAQAGESRGLVLAASDTPAAASSDALPQPLPPVAKSDAKSDTRSDTKSDAQQRQQAREPAPPRARPRSQARHYESDEAKARRIAARYGISW